MSVTTETIVKASATVVSITTLREGDAYKRIEPSTSYRSESLVFGRVLSVMHNGTEAAFTALESDLNTSSTPKLVAHGTGSALALFAATPDEWAAHMADVATNQRRVVDRAASELDEHRRVLAVIEEQMLVPATAPETVPADTLTPSA